MPPSGRRCAAICSGWTMSGSGARSARRDRTGDRGCCARRPGGAAAARGAVGRGTWGALDASGQAKRPAEGQGAVPALAPGADRPRARTGAAGAAAADRPAAGASAGWARPAARRCAGLAAPARRPADAASILLQHAGPRASSSSSRSIRSNVRMYVCGPTVYDYAQSATPGRRSSSTCCSGCCAASTARGHVTYVRNITDVDDKIIAAHRPAGEPIAAITERTTAAYHADIAALGCLPPPLEPRATAIIAEMRAMIARLIEQRACLCGGRPRPVRRALDAGLWRAVATRSPTR